MYIDEDQFQVIFGTPEITQLTGRGSGSIDSDVYDAAAKRADALINDYLRSFYEVPFTNPIPSTIINIASAITRYELYSLDPRESVTELYKEALAMLERIANGKLDLLGAVKIGTTNKSSSTKLRRV
ncbi:MAG: DUF1320 domain-containing protein [Candidatus Scalindua sp.]|jgi:phage gp36-like protein|nr:DUF1320 domain-containing protein [Candidatus Scalindua sp.]